jgi:hypothetical protein
MAVTFDPAKRRSRFVTDIWILRMRQMYLPGAPQRLRMIGSTMAKRDSSRQAGCAGAWL